MRRSPASRLKSRQEVEDIEQSVMNLSMLKPLHNYAVEFYDRAPQLDKNPNADVTLFRDHVLEKGPFITVSDFPKCSKRAAQLRQAANRLFVQLDYKASLEKYNESICWAENGSEELAIGYANRSAVYCAQEEYEVALANIALAKKHCCPEWLTAKLLTREITCQERIANGQSKGIKPNSRLSMNIKVNPKIPFLARGVRMEKLPDFGRSLIADRDFKVGEVILNEKPMILIPCPNCVSVMYCGEQCLKEGLQISHRFECGITEKLHHISYGSSYLGPKLFFYGLGLFGDNPEEMKAYCDSTANATADNPFKLDYSTTKYDRLEEFKVFHNVTSTIPTNDRPFYAAVYYSVYMQHPLVKSLMTTEPLRKFMLCHFLEYMRKSTDLLINNSDANTRRLFTFAGVCNHSCDPNAIEVCQLEQVKLIVFRPITKGDQICISYGPLYADHPTQDRKSMLEDKFDCKCVACVPAKRKSWLVKGNMAPQISTSDLYMAAMVVNEEIGANIAAKLNALQQILQRSGNGHPRKELCSVQTIYMALLILAYKDDSIVMMRAKFAV